MKYSDADIMNADKKGIDYNCGENNLVREGMDFTTEANTEELIVDAAKKGGKKALDASILNSDKQSALSS
tara:strand:- start:926 stop:1135 length:210 start_codon:yes stop_codon:yes gene_type:complete